MQITITFDLPEEFEEFQDSIDGASWHNVCRKLDNLLEDWLDYGHKFEDAGSAIQKIRDTLYSLSDNSKLFLWS